MSRPSLVLALFAVRSPPPRAARRLAALASLLAACAGETPITTLDPTLTTGSTGSSSTGGSTGGLPTTTAPTSTGDASSTHGSTTEPEDPSTGTSTGAPDTTTTTTGATTTGTTTTGTTTDAPDTSTGEPPPSCDDGVHNQDETDLDCGGGCPACGLGSACQVDLDCASEWCAGGECAAPDCLVDLDCAELDEPCADAACDLSFKTCVLAALPDGDPCEDGDLCTSGEQCGGGVCVGGVALDCSGLDNVCGEGACDPDSGTCVAIPDPDLDGQPCDDGFVCTPDDHCEAGLCGVGGPGYLFFESFADPDPGWDLGPAWEIGPALASPPGENGADPADDHGASADQALAGTLIGGLLPAGALAQTCLTSPAIAAAGQDPLVLSFWRHLHTDYFPFATHTVEAYDGDSWEVLEVGYANPGVDDPAWTQVSYDLAPHANAALRVRICVTQNAQALAAAGWSLDDLTVGPYVCVPEE